MSHALVVDDSKTASAMLEKMLKKHNIDAVNVDSAEQALEYLQTQRPAMIFMDHMMPGMDGFDAVKAIKAEPGLATIPIIMHTSKSGEIYVGHARALGAADILIKPASEKALSAVIARLEQNAKLSAETPAKPVTSYANVEQIELADDGDESVVMPAAKLVAKPQNIEPVDYAATTYTKSEQSRRIPGLSLVLVIALVLLALAYNNLRSQLKSNQTQQQAAYQLAAWAVGQAAGFDYGELPLSGRRLSLLQEMLSRLEVAGFKGELIIEGHVGAFCLSEVPIGNGQTELLLAAANIPLSDCAQLGMPAARAISASVEQSLAFKRFINNLPASIQVRVEAKGISEPLYAYPNNAEFTRAGDWNAIALQNNRLTFRLLAN